MATKKKRKFTLFKDLGRPLKVEYPELAVIPEFRNLNDMEMNFVWGWACDTSPYKNLPQQDKMIECIKVFNGTLPQDQVIKFSVYDFPDHIKMAVERMQKFDSNIRISAVGALEKIFDTIQQIADTDVADLEDFEEKSKYVNTAGQIIRMMPQIVHQLENKYGVRYEEPAKKETEQAPVSIEDIVLNDKK